MGFGELLFDNGSGEVNPSLAAVEHNAVTACYDVVGFYQLIIRAPEQLNLPVPVVFLSVLPG